MKFAADGMLGRLARWLRLCGFDVIYVNSRRPSDILGMARREERVILTRSSFLKEHEPDRILLIRSDRVKEQMAEVVSHFNLKVNESTFFTSCSLCNQPLEKMEKNRLKNKVPPYVFKTQEEFYRCPSCQRIYWSGTHRERMVDFLRECLC